MTHDKNWYLLFHFTKFTTSQLRMPKFRFGSGFNLFGFGFEHYFFILGPKLKSNFFSCGSEPGSIWKNSSSQILGFEPGSITQKITSSRIQFKNAQITCNVIAIFRVFFMFLFILTNKNNIKNESGSGFYILELPQIWTQTRTQINPDY